MHIPLAKRLAVAPIAAAVIAGVLTGCGSSGGGGTSDAAFCALLKSNQSALTSIGSSGDLSSVKGVFDKLAAEAPDSVKADFQTLDAAVNDPTSADVSKLGTAAANIAKWGKANCT